ncbi:hypothetical protein IAU60_005078 [Kwoniella sp. DSM 27419]
MAATLYPTLKDSITSVIQSYPSPRADTAPIPAPGLTEQVREAWTTASAGLDASESSSKAGDVVRTVLEVVGRDMVVLPITSGELSEHTVEAAGSEPTAFLSQLQDRLDVVLTLFEVVYAAYPAVPSLEPGALFIPLLEELVELVSVATWRELWLYVETRSKRFTKDMPASRGKALPLLRTINAFLRFLPRTPADLVFRGRVHQFASSVISVADKSAINMRGDYAEVRTTWDEPEEEQVEEGEQDKKDVHDESTKPGPDAEDGEGDVKMEEAVTEADLVDPKQADPAPQEPDFYSTLWSLQQYFAHPPSLDGPAAGSPPRTPFETFKEKSDFVLPQVFAQTQKEKALLGKEADSPSKKRKRDTGEADGGFFHPRYLTGKRLLEHELADPSFRRQILTQYFILFQFLLNLTPGSAGKQAFTGGMPKTFVLGPDDEKWVIYKIQAIREELKKMEDGARFEETVLSIITRERHYAQWKNDQCPESAFELPPLDNTTAKQASAAWEKRLAPPPPYAFKVGSRPLSMLWNNGFKGIDQLKGRPKAVSVEELDDDITRIEMDEDDDRAMGKEPPAEELAANKERKTSLAWRALRLASQTELVRFGTLLPKRDVHVLVQAVKKAREPKPPAVEKQGVGAEAEEVEEEDVQDKEPPPEEVGLDDAVEEKAAVLAEAEEVKPELAEVSGEAQAGDVNMEASGEVAPALVEGTNGEAAEQVPSEVAAEDAVQVGGSVVHTDPAPKDKQGAAGNIGDSKVELTGVEPAVEVETPHEQHPVSEEVLPEAQT